MGLRLTGGIPRRRIEAETGRPLGDWLDPASLRALVDGGFLVDDASRLAATARGRQRLNAILDLLLTQSPVSQAERPALTPLAPLRNVERWL